MRLAVKIVGTPLAQRRERGDVLRGGAAAPTQEATAVTLPYLLPVSSDFAVPGRRILGREQPLRRIEPPDVRIGSDGHMRVRRQLDHCGGDVVRRGAVQQDGVHAARLELRDGLRESFASE